MSGASGGAFLFLQKSLLEMYNSIILVRKCTMETDREPYLNTLQSISLGSLLDQLEIDLSHLGQQNPDQAHRMMLKMDVAAQKISDMLAAHNPVGAESAQFDYLVDSVTKNCSALVRDFGGKEALIKLRETNLPATENSWWFADYTLETQTRKTIKNFAVTLAFLIVIIGAAMVLYNTFLKPDPAVIARYNREMEVDQALAKNDFPTALAAVNQALAIGGDTSSLLILRGVVETLMGKPDQATIDFQTAEAQIGDRSIFLLTRAETWIKAGQFDPGLQDAEEAVQLDPTSPQALFYFGKANEMKQNYNVALAAYQKASDLAEQQGKAELNATIRITMAMLMQSSMGQLPGDVPTPTPR